MRLNKATKAFHDLSFGTSSSNRKIEKAANEIKKVENLASDMCEILKLAISLMDGDSIEDFTYQYKEIQDLINRAEQ